MSSSLSRREFIAGMGAASCLLALGNETLARSATNRPAIDTHVHFHNAGKMSAPSPWSGQLPPGAQTPAEFMRMAGRSGVAGMVVIEAIQSGLAIEDNQWILDEAHRNPAIVGYIGRLEFEAAEFPRQLERFAADPVFRGIRPRGQFDDLAASVAEPAFHRGLRLLSDRGLVFESGGLPPAIPLLTKLARRYPDLRIVFEHLPLIESAQENPEELRAALGEAAALPNVYAKVSHIMRTAGNRPILDPAAYRPGLDALFSLFGPDRVMYGSDWPKPSGIATYDTIHRLAADYASTLDAENAAKFFWRNTIAGYRLDPARVAGVIS